jgi:hypothetical protein
MTNKSFRMLLKAIAAFANVRFGSLADIQLGEKECPLSAKSGPQGHHF